MVSVQCVPARSMLWFYLDVVLAKKAGVFHNGRYMDIPLPNDRLANETDVRDLGEVGGEIIRALFSKEKFSIHAGYVAVEPARFGIGLIGSSDGGAWPEVLPLVMQIVKATLNDHEICFVVHGTSSLKDRPWLEALLKRFS